MQTLPQIYPWLYEDNEVLDFINLNVMMIWRELQHAKSVSTNDNIVYITIGKFNTIIVQQSLINFNVNATIQLDWRNFDCLEDFSEYISESIEDLCLPE